MKNFLVSNMKYAIILSIVALSTTSCNQQKEHLPGPPISEKNSPYLLVKYDIDVNTPTVGITNYTLISNDLSRDSANAREIIQAKVILPLAMQKHDAALFDRVLAKDFISQGEDEFFNREEYIRDRVSGTWMISDVQYENLVLAFYDGYGILTYTNKVKEKDEFGKEQLFTWIWTDVWVKENGQWKLRELRSLN